MDIHPPRQAGQKPPELGARCCFEAYLLKCGGGFSKISQTHYGCSTARNKGTCDNRLGIRQNELEGLVISAL
ncbi:MAG TPA: recombinase zinc beta ribbon domain-containing protein [Paracoccaceae bacterium]|nr:recombinase zinc beta ribbon domain-containing protein [Paracoccaceae bacterium]